MTGLGSTRLRFAPGASSTDRSRESVIPPIIGRRSPEALARGLWFVQAGGWLLLARPPLALGDHRPAAAGGHLADAGHRVAFPERVGGGVAKLAHFVTALAAAKAGCGVRGLAT